MTLVPNDGDGLEDVHRPPESWESCASVVPMVVGPVVALTTAGPDSGSTAHPNVSGTTTEGAMQSNTVAVGARGLAKAELAGPQQDTGLGVYPHPIVEVDLEHDVDWDVECRSQAH